MPIVKLLERCSKVKLNNENEVLLRANFNKLNKEQYRELYNDLYGKLYKHKKLRLFDRIKIFISSLKEAH